MLRGADLRGVRAGDAWALRADLRAADLRGARAERIVLRDAVLIGADLRGADLRSADLRSADLTDADLRDADLRGANLRGAGLSDTLVAGARFGAARYDRRTTWPTEGFDPRAHGMVPVRPRRRGDEAIVDLSRPYPHVPLRPRWHREDRGTLPGDGLQWGEA